ncbi:hypothetical protein [Nocardiopsis synnemataformans]|uniref:hypothetical protein n=1 Tax=Nocardiopsis synnemataformans TaxID=61305 RepID=UPI003EB9F464
MNRARWIWAAAASVAIFAALGAGLWFGGGPGTRDGWEAASWSAGITTALALIVTAITWAVTSRSSPASPSPGSGSVSTTANTVNGDVSGSTIVQGQEARVDNPSYGGDHLDFRSGTFHGPVIGKQVDRPRPGLGDEGQDPER